MWSHEREKMNLTAPSPVLAEPAVLCNPDGSDNLIGLPCSASIMGNLFLMAVYGGLLAYGAERISTGSEKLLEVRGPFPNNEIVGSFLRLFVCVLSPSGPLSPSISVCVCMCMYACMRACARARVCGCGCGCGYGCVCGSAQILTGGGPSSWFPHLNPPAMGKGQVLDAWHASSHRLGTI